VKTIFQSIVANAIWWLAFLAGSGLVAFLTVTHPNYAVSVMYGAITFACFGVIFYTVTGRSLGAKASAQIDARNLEPTLQAWIASLGFASEPLTVPDAAFGYKVTLFNGVSLVVFRGIKRKKEYLQFQMGLVVSPEHRSDLLKLTTRQAWSVIHELSLELARIGVTYHLTFPQSTSQHPTPNQLEMITVAKEVVFSGLTEAIFSSQVSAIDSAGLVVRTALSLALSRFQNEDDTQPPQIKGPSPLQEVSTRVQHIG